MAIGRSHPKRRAPADRPTHSAGVLGALLAVAGILFVIVMITRGYRAPARGGAASGRATNARPHAAAATKAGTEARGADVRAKRAPADAADSGAWRPAPYETASLGPEDRGATPSKRQRDWNEASGGPPDVVAPDARREIVSGGTGDGSPRHHRRRRRPPADGAPTGGAAAAASRGQHTVVASEVETQHETLGETPAGQLAGLAGGDRTATVAAPSPGPPTVSASGAETEYDTQSETDAGELKGLTGGGGTISFWLQPAWDGTSQDDASFVRISDDRLRVYKSDRYLRFEITDADGQATVLGMPITDWNPGDWHQVVTTWDGHVISFFVDGKLIGQNAYAGQIELPPDPKLYVGTNAPEQPVAPGLLADVRVHNRPLTPDAVSRRFEGSRPPQR